MVPTRDAEARCGVCRCRLAKRFEPRRPCGYARFRMATQLATTGNLQTKVVPTPGPGKRHGNGSGDLRKTFCGQALPAAKECHEQERQRLVVAMLPLVKRMAFQMRTRLPAHIEVDELVGNGVLGLVDAVSKFDNSKRVKPESYARHRIRGGMLDGLRALDPVSRDMRRKNKKVEGAYRELEAKLGRAVSDEEVSAALGMSLKAWHRTLRELRGVGLDGWGRVESAGSVGNRQASGENPTTSRQENPFESCYRREQQEILNRAVARLPERQRLVITLYYQRELAMKQIAAQLNVDESRVSQLHAAALLRLKSCVQALLRPPRPALPAARAVPVGATA